MIMTVGFHPMRPMGNLVSVIIKSIPPSHPDSRYAPYLYTTRASYGSSSTQTHISNHRHYWRLGAIPGTWQSSEAEALCFLSSFMENQIKNQIVSRPRKPLNKDSGERKRLLVLNQH